MHPDRFIIILKQRELFFMESCPGMKKAECFLSLPTHPQRQLLVEDGLTSSR